ncbi:hypothetical protein K0M31_003049 [Melipona bicolor]|uniref:Uncharacterized protein n=1 Tax=Melipona bicolor TaxID=60889 RepID=A0AA40G064_9HYME|nr:hypothetical protein K0M31_003049 [Melipona bicolor]
MVDRRLKPVAAAPVILYDPTVTTVLWYKARVTSTSSSCTLRSGFVMWIVIDGNVITAGWSIDSQEMSFIVEGDGSACSKEVDLWSDPRGLRILGPRAIGASEPDTLS